MRAHATNDYGHAGQGREVSIILPNSLKSKGGSGLVATFYCFLGAL